MGAQLRQLCLEYCRLAHANPVDASDPRFIDQIMSAAIDDMSDGYAALHAPIAPWRAEARCVLPGIENNTTQRVPLTFPWPVLLVGMRPVVKPIRPVGGGLVVPDFDDIDVMLDVNLTTQLNTSQGTTAAAGAASPFGSNFLSLGSIGVQEPCLFGAAIKDPRPDLGFTYRWTQTPVGSPIVPIFADVFIKTVVYYIPMFPQESSNVAPSLRNAP